MFNPMSATCNAYQAKFGPVAQPGNAHSIFSAWIQGSNPLMSFQKDSSLKFSNVTRTQAAHSLKLAKVRQHAGLVAATVVAVAMAILAVAANVSSMAFIANPITLSVLGAIALIAAAVSLISHAKFKNSIRATDAKENIALLRTAFGELGSEFSSLMGADSDATPVPPTPTPLGNPSSALNSFANLANLPLTAMSGVTGFFGNLMSPSAPLPQVDLQEGLGEDNDVDGEDDEQDEAPISAPWGKNWMQSAQSSWLADEDDGDAPQAPKAMGSILSATGKVGSVLSGIGSFFARKPAPTPAPAPQE